MARIKDKIKKIILISLIIGQVGGFFVYISYAQPYIYYQQILGPYLSWSGDGLARNLSSTTITVSWRTENAEIGKLVYWSGSGAKSTLIEVNQTRQHSFRLEDLTPGTEYKYQVGNEKHLTQVLTFTTIETNPSVLRFSIWADTQPPGTRIRDAFPLLDDNNPDFWIQCGDLVSTGANWDHWEEYLQVLKPLSNKIVFMPVSGNHDYGDNPNLENFREVFALTGTETSFAYNVGDILFIALDTHFGDILTNETQWANQTLYDNYLDYKWIVLYSHYPPFSTWENYTTVRADYLPLAETYDVDVVFTGHVHNYERLVFNNSKTGNTTITYFVAGGGGGGLDDIDDPRWEQSEVYISEHHVLHAEVTSTQFNVEMKNIENIIRDQCTLTPKNRTYLNVTG